MLLALGQQLLFLPEVTNDDNNLIVYFAGCCNLAFPCDKK